MNLMSGVVGEAPLRLRGRRPHAASVWRPRQDVRGRGPPSREAAALAGRESVTELLDGPRRACSQRLGSIVVRMLKEMFFPPCPAFLG